MTKRSGAFLASLLLPLVAGLSATASAETDAAELPPVVAGAIAEDDCARLAQLNRRYWADQQAEVLGQLPDDILPIVGAIERRILQLPGCGATAAELVQVEPVSGANFFDPSAPASLNGSGGGRALPGLAPGSGSLAMRELHPITRPGESVRLGQEFLPVPRALIERAVEALLVSWNAPSLAPLLAADFYRRDQLLAAFVRVPADARLRLLSVGGIQTLNQQALGSGAVASLVSVTVRAQLEYNDPRSGFQRREGTAEYIFRIVRRVPR